MATNLLIMATYSVIFLISLFVFWQSMTTAKKHEGILYKNKRPLLPEHIFDFWVASGIISVLMARIFFVISNVSQYVNLGWSFTPWLRVSENKTEWFTKYPWVLVNLVDGLDLGGFLLAFFLVFLVVIWLARLDLKNVLYSFKNGIVSIIVLMIIFYLISGVFGLNQEVTFDLDMGNFLMGNIYFLVLVLLTIVFLVIDVVYLKNKRVEEDNRRLKLTFLIFSGYFSAVYMLIRLEQNFEFLLIYLALVPLLIGLLLYFFYSREVQLTEDSNVLDKPAAALKINLFKKKSSKKA